MLVSGNPLMRPAMSIAPKSSDCPSPAVRERVASATSRVRVRETQSASRKWLKDAVSTAFEFAPAPSCSHCSRNGSLPLPQCGRGAYVPSSIGAVASHRTNAFDAIRVSGRSLKVQSGNIIGRLRRARASSERGDAWTIILSPSCIFLVLYRRTSQRGSFSLAPARGHDGIVGTESCFRMA
jgi:hypothetical protein